MAVKCIQIICNVNYKLCPSPWEKGLGMRCSSDEARWKHKKYQCDVLAGTHNICPDENQGGPAPAGSLFLQQCPATKKYITMPHTRKYQKACNPDAPYVSSLRLVFKNNLVYLIHCIFFTLCRPAILPCNHINQSRRFTLKKILYSFLLNSNY